MAAPLRPLRSSLLVTRSAALVALSGAAIAALLLLPDAPLLAVASVALAVAAAVFAFTDVVRDKLGGHTGDTIGASEQFAEIAALAALALAL